jgi:dihydroneopterin aldolase / 2-amino-4-hydroxy-6-hydroxymethyldihydropteridine diphosphokinase
MIDRIELRGLRLMPVIGVLDHERQAPQPIEVDVTLHVDLTDACQTDELDDTVHYGEVCETIEKIAHQRHDLLLERFAGRIAEAILDSQPRVEAVDLKVTKLRPPIPSDVATSAVAIHRSRAGTVALDAGHHRAILALGSNLGDRAGYLRFATRHLGNVVAESEVYETDPIGPGEQGAYLNMVVAVDTSLDPFALLRRCQRVEAAAGRERKVHWGPRTLDVDVLFYDDVTMNSPTLVIPHPRIIDRGFVLAPLHDVAPERTPANWKQLADDGGVRAIGRLDVV